MQTHSNVFSLHYTKNCIQCASLCICFHNVLILLKCSAESAMTAMMNALSLSPALFVGSNFQPYDTYITFFNPFDKYSWLLAGHDWVIRPCSEGVLRNLNGVLMCGKERKLMNGWCDSPELQTGVKTLQTVFRDSNTRIIMVDNPSAHSFIQGQYRIANAPTPSHWAVQWFLSHVTNTIVLFLPVALCCGGNSRLCLLNAT